MSYFQQYSNLKKIIFIILLIPLLMNFVFAESNIKHILKTDILFFPDSDKIKDESIIELEKIIKILNENDNYIIGLSGHTNSIGNPIEELELSLKRANVIALYLNNNGIRLSKIKTYGYGGKKLKENVITETNRRVEVTILGKEEIKNFDEAYRKLKITVVDKNKKNLVSTITIKQRQDNNVTYNKTYNTNKPIIIDVPSSNNIILTAVSKGFKQKRININIDEEEKIIILENINSSSGYVADFIFFKPNTFRLNINSYKIVDEIIELLKKDEKLKVEIRGYSDTNLPETIELAEKRSEKIKEYLISKDIKEDRITSKGTNTKTLNIYNKSNEERRKIEFYFYK